MTIKNVKIILDLFHNVYLNEYLIVSWVSK